MQQCQRIRKSAKPTQSALCGPVSQRRRSASRSRAAVKTNPPCARRCSTMFGSVRWGSVSRKRTQLRRGSRCRKVQQSSTKCRKVQRRGNVQTNPPRAARARSVRPFPPRVRVPAVAHQRISTTGTIGVAIIGSGGIALANHLPGFALCPRHASVVALCDTDPAVLDARRRQRTGITRRFTDYQQAARRTPTSTPSSSPRPTTCTPPIALAAVDGRASTCCARSRSR